MALRRVGTNLEEIRRVKDLFSNWVPKAKKPAFRTIIPVGPLPVEAFVPCDIVLSLFRRDPLHDLSYNRHRTYDIDVDVGLVIKIFVSFVWLKKILSGNENNVLVTP